ncbi:MAG: hypothetical protein E7213_07490 [Clostridium sp.]|nr:hypothetical protein [Clostridium sp.]
MSKPSIFSKDYERRMKKRKRIAVLITVVAICVVGIVIFNTKIKKLDFTNLRANIQAWVDSGETQEQLENENIDDNNEEVKEKEEIKPEELFVNVILADGVNAKLKYIENNGVKQIETVEVPEGYQFNISPQKDKVVFLDPAQNMKVSNIEGNIIDITKKEYISQAGSTFPKDQILSATPTYTWHSQPKFIDDNIIVYVSELPYFKSSGQKKYIWICDLAQNTHRTVWNFVGTDIVIGDVLPEKGISITVDGNVYYMNSNGEISQ